MPLESFVPTILTTGATILSGWLLNRQNALHKRLDGADEQRAAQETRLSVLEALAETKNDELKRLDERLNRIDDKLNVLPQLKATLDILLRGK